MCNSLLENAGASSGVSWTLGFDCLCHIRQPLNRRQLVCRSKVRVAYGHLDGLVARQFLDGSQIYPGHNESGGECVPQVMPVEIRELGSQSRDCSHAAFYYDTARWGRWAVVRALGD